jgi:hypothetical protein
MQISSLAHLYTLKIVIPAQAGIHRIRANYIDMPYSAQEKYPVEAASAANAIPCPYLSVRSK